MCFFAKKWRLWCLWSTVEGVASRETARPGGGEGETSSASSPSVAWPWSHTACGVAVDFVVFWTADERSDPNWRPDPAEYSHVASSSNRTKKATGQKTDQTIH